MVAHAPVGLKGLARSPRGIGGVEEIEPAGHASEHRREDFEPQGKLEGKRMRPCEREGQSAPPSSTIAKGDVIGLLVMTGSNDASGNQ